MSKDETLTILKKISEDIAVIKRYARFQALSAMSNVLKVVAKTPERQEMWRMADGTHSNEEIANRIGVTLRGVQYFTQETEDAGLIIMEKRGYPKRVIDMTPPEWKPWKPRRAYTEVKSEAQKIVIKEENPDVKT